MSRWCSRGGGTYHYQQKHNKDSSAEPVPGDLPLLSPGEGCSTHCEAEKKERTLIKQLERKGKARGVRKERKNRPTKQQRRERGNTEEENQAEQERDELGSQARF